MLKACANHVAIFELTMLEYTVGKLCISNAYLFERAELKRKPAVLLRIFALIHEMPAGIRFWLSFWTWKICRCPRRHASRAFRSGKT